MSNKLKLIADEKIPFLKGVFEPIANIEYLPDNEINRERIIDADALIIRTRTKCSRELLKNTSVKLIASATIGFDHINTDYCEENNIKWVNAPGCNSSSVQQYITSALLNLAEKDSINLTGKTIGIIGVGNVGSKVQKVAEILGMNILLNDPPRAREEGSDKFVDIQTIQENADIITFHTPLIKEGINKTYHLANDNFFRVLKKKPIIINSARGEVTKTNAIKNAIKNNWVSNVVLDVWENEPYIDFELLNMVSIATPHIAGYSIDGKAMGTAACVRALNQYFQLGLESNWFPKELFEAPNGNVVSLNTEGKRIQELLFEAVLHTYNIYNDHYKFIAKPELFEKFRNNYPIRREFSYYKVIQNPHDEVITKKLKQLGFIV